MIHPERIPHNDAEGAAIDKLLAEHEGEQASFTRRDPGETGPLVISFDGGEDTWEIAEDGKRKKVT